MYLTRAEERQHADAKKYGTSGGFNEPITINYPKSDKRHVPKQNFYRGQPSDYGGWARFETKATPLPVCISAYCIVCHPENVMTPGSVGAQLQKRTRHVS